MTRNGQLDLKHYSKALESARKAETNADKKTTLEKLAKMLFESIPFLTCKFTNIRTASSEIDLVIQYKGWIETTVFDDLGTYFLVECKNWKEPVGAKHVRDFIQKIEKSMLNLGVLIAPQGVTGANQGMDALREIHSAFDRLGLYVVVVRLDQLRAIEEGADFYQILEEEIARLRFDFIFTESQ